MEEAFLTRLINEDDDFEDSIWNDDAGDNDADTDADTDTDAEDLDGDGESDVPSDDVASGDEEPIDE